MAFLKPLVNHFFISTLIMIEDFKKTFVKLESSSFNNHNGNVIALKPLSTSLQYFPWYHDQLKALKNLIKPAIRNAFSHYRPNLKRNHTIIKDYSVAVVTSEPVSGLTWGLGAAVLVILAVAAVALHRRKRVTVRSHQVNWQYIVGRKYVDKNILMTCRRIKKCAVLSILAPHLIFKVWSRNQEH